MRFNILQDARINGSRLGHPVEAHQAGTNLMHWLGFYTPLLSSMLKRNMQRTTSSL